MNVINNYCGLFAVNINSNRVSAQNRNRWYWSNIRTKQVGLFGETHTDIPQPKDRGILLKDILEKEVPEKYYLSDKMLNYFDKRAANFNAGKVNIRAETDKATTLCASMSSCDISDNFVLDTKLKPKENQTKANCFTAGGNSGGLHSDMDLICVAMRGRGDNNDQQLEPNYTGKTNTITSVQKDNLVMQLNERQQNNFKNGDEKANTFLSTSWKGSQANGMTLVVSEATAKGFIEVEPGEYFDFENPKSKTRRGRKMEDKSNCLMAKETDFMQYTQTNRIRRLTPLECARLQTIPEWYKWGCSDTQQYRMLGNGWTVQVIAHILSFLNRP
jgi:DNA (cytosine-5)-methyltransferase 3A